MTSFKMINKHPPSRSFLRSARQRGFALVELIVVVSVMAILGVYASSQMVHRAEENIAEAAGTYISAVAKAAETHVLMNFLSYQNGTPIPGVLVLNAPTIAELVALGRLNPGFPSGPGAVPTRQSLAISVTPQNCPGPNCTLTTLACTTTPVTLGGPITRFDLASTMVSSQGGRGGQSLPGNGSVIRGPVIAVSNLIPGMPEGIVCGSSIVDTALFNIFVRMNDTRDPNLQGPLTVRGPVSLAGTLQAAGDTSVGTCARILATTGRAGFGCANPDDLPAGYTGGVRTPDVVASGRILVSDNPAAFTGNNGNFAFVGLEGGVAEVRTSGRVAANRLTPLGAYPAGAACPAAETGSIARNSLDQGLVFCQSGIWVSLSTLASAGAACGPDGSMATAGNGVRLLCVGGVYVNMNNIIRSASPNQPCTQQGSTAIDLANANEMLICRMNLAGGGARFMRLRDTTSHLSFVSATEVTDSQHLAKPNCAPASGQQAFAIVQLIGKGYSSPDGGVDMFAQDLGAVWLIRLRDGAGAPLRGNPRPLAVAQVFCYFP